MIYLFAGDDVKNKFLNYEKLINSISIDLEKLFINRNNFNKMQIESLASGAGLFFNESIIVFSDILEKEEISVFILEKLSLMQTSPNIFIFIENKLDKIVLEKFKKNNTYIKIFELLKDKKEKFNNFLIANAFSAKNKLQMWIYFREAMNNEVEIEELVGVLFWKIKDMILKKDFKNFSENKLKDLAFNLSYLLPQAREDGVDVEIAFEKLLLEIL